MGRSVSTPSNARHVMFIHWMPDEEFIEEELAEHEFDCEHDRESFLYNHLVPDEWDYFKYDLVNHVLKHVAPSVDETDYWLDRTWGGSSEDHVVAENELVSFGISEYAGLASVWAVVREDRWDNYGDRNLTGLAQSWVDKVWPQIEAMYPNRLELVGRFSNGNAVYTRAGKE